jgi:DNA-binding IclR family transcriptional regulator
MGWGFETDPEYQAQLDWADALVRQLTCARENDLAVEHGETVVGQSCLAVGIYEREGRVLAALSICTPTETMHSRHEEFAKIVRKAAGCIAHRYNEGAR